MTTCMANVLSDKHYENGAECYEQHKPKIINFYLKKKKK